MPGVQITDSEYVVVSMHLMSGASAMGFATFGDDAEFLRYVHSVGAPRRPGQPDVPWPCDHTKYVAQFPETHTIWSYGSGFVSNALLGKDFDLIRCAAQPTRRRGPRHGSAQGRDRRHGVMVRGGHPPPLRDLRREAGVSLRSRRFRFEHSGHGLQPLSSIEDGRVTNE